MAVNNEFEAANQRARRRRARSPAPVSAHYDHKTGRIVLRLSSGADFSFPPEKAQGLEEATPGQLEPIEISPSGFGLHFPKLDADLYVPSLLEGLFGSRRWMAARLGAAGGSSRSKVKIAASRANGKSGGRPRKSAEAG